MAKKTLYFDTRCDFALYAATEDGKLTDCAFETNDNGNIIGNIYKGRVTNLLNGMQAAFIDCGLKRNCYISVEDLYPDRTRYGGTEIDIPEQLHLKVGDEIMVQVLKAPLGKKGAKVTTNVTFVGKFCIYMPTTPFVGVSRKICQPQLRQKLFADAESLRQGDEGIIIRTAATYSIKEDKQAELNYFRKLYQKVKKHFERAQVGELIYSDSALYDRAIRDTIIHDVEKIYVGSPQLERQIDGILSLIPRTVKPQLILHDNGTDMFSDLKLSEQLKELMHPRANLKNGAYLVIEQTEALTVIDVNTGKYIGCDSLEDTAYQTNLLAAAEVARQVRLRDIAGIVVVDFIDMSDEEHNKQLVESLENALSADKATCHVAPMSQFGLVEFTRKRVCPSPVALMKKPCSRCHGIGYTRSTEFILFDVRARLLEILHNGNKVVCVDMEFNLAHEFLAWQSMIDSIKAYYPDAKIYVTPHRGRDEENITYSTAPIPQNATALF